MLIKILLVIAILIQSVATAYALKLVRATKYNSVWILFIVGFSLLSVERFVQLLMASGQYVPRWWFAYLGIVISICLSIGVMYAHKLFKYIGRLNRQRQLLNKRILTAVLRTEEKARSRFSKELHDGLGPLLSSARMSRSASGAPCCRPTVTPSPAHGSGSGSKPPTTCLRTYSTRHCTRLRSQASTYT